MTVEQAQEFTQKIKLGKIYINIGSRMYTGDYTMTIIRYHDQSFHYELYDCHPDAGERLVRSNPKTEDEVH